MSQLRLTSKGYITGNNAILYNKYGILPLKKLHSSLQGSIYIGRTLKDCKIVVIKRCGIKYHKKGISIDNIKINENILKENKILKYLNNNNNEQINGIPKYYGFICDGKSYFLIQQYCGKNLFNHVKIYHEKIDNNELSINEWKNHCKILFNQMVNIIYYLHVNCNVCHLDISLENFTIDNIIFKNGKFIKHGNIYLIDYGLSEYFGKNNASFECSKFVGKVHCQSPEIRSRNVFNAQLSDIWSFGCVLFMMLMNSLPMNVASKNDEHFCNIVNGHLKQMLLDTNKIHYIDSECIDLLNKMLTIEKKRINIKNIIKHKYYLL